MKFYPYKKGGGCRNWFSQAEREGGRQTSFLGSLNTGA